MKVNLINSFKIKAFTLAEVLITLGIIGVVASMTMPALINKMNDRANVTALKKAYTVLSQALMMAKYEYEDYEYWNIVDYDMNSTTEIYNYLKPHLKVIKECPNQIVGCWKQVKSLKGTNINNEAGMGDSVYNFVLNDGTNISMNIYSSDSDKTLYGVGDNTLPAFIGFWVDVNGNKNPNQIGRDVFLLVLYKKGLQPAGLDNDSADCHKNGFGYTCAAKVIQEGAVKY